MDGWRKKQRERKMNEGKGEQGVRVKYFTFKYFSILLFLTPFHPPPLFFLRPGYFPFSFFSSFLGYFSGILFSFCFIQSRNIPPSFHSSCLLFLSPFEICCSSFHLLFLFCFILFYFWRVSCTDFSFHIPVSLSLLFPVPIYLLYLFTFQIIQIPPPLNRSLLYRALKSPSFFSSHFFI